MAGLIYQNSVLVGSTKTGLLKPDANGYYELALGAFNYHNSRGDFYTLEPFKKLLESSSNLMRRINRGALRSEYGHPRFDSTMSKRDIMLRVLDIHEDKTCAHIKSIELDEQRVIKDGVKVAAVIGMVKPSGPMGDALAQQLANPDENVCFSIRSLTDDCYQNGKLIKNIKEAVTWDYVNEPGIDIATKYNSPSLESIVFDDSDIRAAYDKAILAGVSMESTKEILESLKVQQIKHLGRVQAIRGTRPFSSQWR